MIKRNFQAFWEKKGDMRQLIELLLWVLFFLLIIISVSWLGYFLVNKLAG